MTDVRLVATNPEDSSLVPVASNSRGELLTQAPKIELVPNDVEIDGNLQVNGDIVGSDGQPIGGGGIVLPPDPYEGAVLGWLNGGLAWVGTPPVEIPEGVFGPIIGWDPVAGTLTVDGDIPASIGNGVYVHQCDATGALSTSGWNIAEQWSANTTGTALNESSTFANAFNGSTATADGNAFASEDGVYTCLLDVPVNASVTFYALNPQANSTHGILINDAVSLPSSEAYSTPLMLSAVQLDNRLTSIQLKNEGVMGPYLQAVEVDGLVLVNTDQSLNLRVNNVVDQVLVGVPNQQHAGFTPGMYLKTLDQRVAPWLLRSGQLEQGMLQGP